MRGSEVHGEVHARGQDLQASSATKRARPIPTGATNVLGCFSAASMRITKRSRAVQNISMKTPLTMETPGERVVAYVIGPGNMQSTRAAAMMPPRISAGRRKSARVHSRDPLSTIPRRTWVFMLMESLEVGLRS